MKVRISNQIYKMIFIPRLRRVRITQVAVAAFWSWWRPSMRRLTSNNSTNCIEKEIKELLLEVQGVKLYLFKNTWASHTSLSIWITMSQHWQSPPLSMFTPFMVLLFPGSETAITGEDMDNALSRRMYSILGRNEPPRIVWH